MSPLTASCSGLVGDSCSAAYDLGLGEVLHTQDEARNPTYRTFDAFGRMSALYGPYDAPGSATPTVSVQPAWALIADKLPQPKRDGSLTLDNVVFMDGLATRPPSCTTCWAATCW